MTPSTIDDMRQADAEAYLASACAELARIIAIVRQEQAR